MLNCNYFLSLKFFSCSWLKPQPILFFVLLESFPRWRLLCDEEVAEEGGASPWGSETDQSGQGTLFQSELSSPA